MNQLESVLAMVGVLIICMSFLTGMVYSIDLVNDFRYVGDKETKIVYDLSKCDISHVQKSNKMRFLNMQEALEYGYYEAECNS